MERENKREEHENEQHEQHDDEMLTIDEVAKDLGIGTGPLRHEYREHGWLLPVKLTTKTLRYTREALENFKNKHTINRPEEKHE